MTLNKFYSLSPQEQLKFIMQRLSERGRVVFEYQTKNGIEIRHIDWSKVKDKRVTEYYLLAAADIGANIDYEEFLLMDDETKYLWLEEYFQKNNQLYDYKIENWIKENNTDNQYSKYIEIHDKNQKESVNKGMKHVRDMISQINAEYAAQNDFSNMSDDEIRSEMDAALDAGDEDRYYELQKALNNKKLNEEILKIKKMML